MSKMWVTGESNAEVIGPSSTVVDVRNGYDTPSHDDSFQMPTRTAVILLGASHFPNHEDLGETASFYTSKEAIRRYLVDTLRADPILDLFDSPEPPSTILVRISSFIESDLRASFGSLASNNLFVYYVGHGYPARGDPDEYFLALASTTRKHPDFTALDFRSLARILRSDASTMRKFIILDSCYAGSALGHMGSGETPQSVLSARASALLRAGEVQDSSTPTKGTALYCAADRDAEALAPPGEQYTMFSGAILHALSAGRDRQGRFLSLDDVHQTAWEYISERYGKQGIRPALHAPDQSGGNIATKVYLFPNVKWHYDIEFEHHLAEKAAQPAQSNRVAPVGLFWLLLATLAIWLAAILLRPGEMYFAGTNSSIYNLVIFWVVHALCSAVIYYGADLLIKDSWWKSIMLGCSVATVAGFVATEPYLHVMAYIFPRMEDVSMEAIYRTYEENHSSIITRITIWTTPVLGPLYGFVLYRLCRTAFKLVRAVTAKLVARGASKRKGTDMR
ncbi:caspase family protein [Paraburkholderia sp. J10-1]|uniref:caspase family protein n=1 Tax=Paraburkholderia sp. J10-1 TaxID=2805430 RepID=UPI002AB5E647|nr:caspase family protein [Paraburkholderia sp. J10-1]